MAVALLNAFTKKVADLPDTPNGNMTSLELKQQFDAAPEELRIKLNEVITAKAEKTQEGWITPTLLNSWTSTLAVAYYKDEFGVVHIKGMVSGGALGTTIFLLPTGYRPLQSTIFAGIANGSNAYLRVLSDGSLRLETGATTGVALDISFTTL